MNITGVRTHLFSYDLIRPIGDANRPSGWAKGSHLAVFIDTDVAITGVTRTRGWQMDDARVRRSTKWQRVRRCGGMSNGPHPSRSESRALLGV